MSKFDFVDSRSAIIKEASHMLFVATLRWILVAVVFLLSL